MSEETVARRYSIALADVVLKSGETETVSRELAAWNDILRSSPDLTNVFSNPAIPHFGKEKLLEELISRSKPTKTTSNFLRILLRNGRMSEAGRINERFSAVLEERSGLVAAEDTPRLAPGRQCATNVRAAPIPRANRLDRPRFDSASRSIPRGAWLEG